MQYPALDGAVMGVKAAILLFVLGGIIAALTHCGGSVEHQPTASWSTGLGVSPNAVADRCVPDTLVGCGLGSTDEGVTCITVEPAGDCGLGSVEGNMSGVEVVAYCCSREP